MRVSTLATFAATIALASGPVSYGITEAEPSLVLVVPSRYAFVKMAQDLRTLRPITVVSYSTTNNASLFIWDADGAKWSPLDAAAFAAGTGFGVSSHLVVMGTDAATVNIFAASAKAWATKTTSFPKFDLVGALNAANETLRFSRSEWEWLSDRYGLSFKDSNDERRRYGRYGDPKKPKKTPPPKAAPAPAADVVLPEPVPPPPAAPAAAAPQPPAEATAPAEAPKTETAK